jgi:hypothetical protein
MDPRRPIGGTPGLDDPWVRRQFDVAPFNAAAKQLERFAGARLNFGRVLGTRAELLCVQQNFIDTRGRRFEVDFLVMVVPCFGT